MSSSPEPPAADPTSGSAMDPTPLINEYLASPPQDQDGTLHPPPPPHATPPQEEEEEEERPPRLVKPENIRSRFWVHFHKYDLEFHPDKKNTARCNMCGKDISVKQGTGGLKNHLKFKHPEENSLLFVDDEAMGSSSPTPRAQCVKVEVVESPSTRGGGTVPPHSAPPRKKLRAENAYADITVRMDAEKRINEKHWMEMWALTRRELRALRQELKGEEDADAVRDLENDMRIMERKKADYAELLGYGDLNAPANPSNAPANASANTATHV